MTQDHPEKAKSLTAYKIFLEMQVDYYFSEKELEDKLISKLNAEFTTE